MENPMLENVRLKSNNTKKLNLISPMKNEQVKIQLLWNKEKPHDVILTTISLNGKKSVSQWSILKNAKRQTDCGDCGSPLTVCVDSNLI